MAFQELKLIFNEKSNQINMELTNYLDKNLSEIIYKANIYFRFIIATEADNISLKKEGITKLPAIILPKNKPILGLQNIYKYIKYAMTNKIKQNIKTEEEILQDFMNKEIQNGVSRVKEGSKKKVVIKEEEENDEFSSDNINRRIQNEQKKRGLGSNSSNMDEIYTPNRPNNLSMDENDENENDENENDENNENEFSNNTIETNNKNNRSNIKNDPINVFNNMSDGNSNQDDEMMLSLLERIGDN